MTVVYLDRVVLLNLAVDYLLLLATARLAGLPATVVQINFRYAGQALEQLGIEKINGALLDLGVSSHQLDDAARGAGWRRGSLCAVWPGGGNAVPGG